MHEAFGERLAPSEFVGRDARRRAAGPEERERLLPLRRRQEGACRRHGLRAPRREAARRGADGDGAAAAGVRHAQRGGAGRRRWRRPLAARRRHRRRLRHRVPAVPRRPAPDDRRAGRAQVVATLRDLSLNYGDRFRPPSRWWHWPSAGAPSTGKTDCTGPDAVMPHHLHRAQRSAARPIHPDRHRPSRGSISTVSRGSRRKCSPSPRPAAAASVPPRPAR